MNGCPSCVTIGSIGKMRLPCTLPRSPSTIPTTLPPTPQTLRRVPLSERYTCAQRSTLLLKTTWSIRNVLMHSTLLLLMNIIISFTIFTEVDVPLLKNCMKEANCYWTDLWVCLLLQCMSIRRQSTVPSAGAFPLNCTSQAKVAAWLQSSDDMDKCSKGETVETAVPRGLWSFSTLTRILMHFSICDFPPFLWFLSKMIQCKDLVWLRVKNNWSNFG